MSGVMVIKKPLRNHVVTIKKSGVAPGKMCSIKNSKK
jgi:hypothetical protein